MAEWLKGARLENDSGELHQVVPKFRAATGRAAWIRRLL
jgi:hypothetical protein